MYELHEPDKEIDIALLGFINSRMASGFHKLTESKDIYPYSVISLHVDKPNSTMGYLSHVVQTIGFNLPCYNITINCDK